MNATVEAMNKLPATTAVLRRDPAGETPTETDRSVASLLCC
ncbi:hypothetical protein [Kribbella antiqua]|nr:hypothetical protein [Kribbella antiqua]